MTRTTCEWLQDEQDPAAYEAQCGRWFFLANKEKTPKESHMAYCCYCGRALIQTLFERDDE